MLETLITSKTRLKLLIKFFVSSTNTGYLRGIADEFNESTNAIRKELNLLSEADFLTKNQKDNKIYYKANSKHPLFDSLQKLIHSYLGIDKVVEKMLDRAGEVTSVSLIGDYAKGADSEVIEVLVLGGEMDKKYILGLARKTSNLLNKEVKLYFEKPYHIDQQIVVYNTL